MNTHTSNHGTTKGIILYHKILPILLLLITTIMCTSCTKSVAPDQSSTENISTDDISTETIYTVEPVSSIYKDDYLEACQLFADTYVYLEEKLLISREQFLIDSKGYADSIDWEVGGSEQFIKEIRKLIARFPDHHVSWNIDSSLYTQDYFYNLGLILTVSKDMTIKVGKVIDNSISNISEKDIVLKINGNDAYNEIKEFSSLMPQSTEAGTLETAARMYAVEYKFRPYRDQLDPVTLTLKNSNDDIYDVHLKWSPCALTTSVSESVDEGIMLLTNNALPSLEELPSDIEYINESLPYYYRTVNDTNIAILHVRNFAKWEQEDLDKTMGIIMTSNPDMLFLDLKDTSGGYFDHVLYLSHAIGIHEPFEFYLKVVDPNTHEITESVEDFNTIANTINLTNIWHGKTMLRINSICASGSDFFPRWFQLHDRGLVVGQPTGGAGGGTDDFELTHTKTTISISRRDRQILLDPKPIEGHSVIPEILDDRELMEILKDVIK